jgi:hypothetical protein
MVEGGGAKNKTPETSEEPPLLLQLPTLPPSAPCRWIGGEGRE